jgi:radical SAM superfamily enzyme with C-terminal helix-hairpin-helix motif
MTEEVRMTGVTAILDCYTVEPSGLGVPPYLSTYARNAYDALVTAFPGTNVRYLTIDDVRWCLNGGRPYAEQPLSDPLTYSATASREQALKVLADADMVVTIAGNAVPSVHLQAQNGSVEEISRALASVRGQRVLLGPLASYVISDPDSYRGLLNVVHTHTVTSADLGSGSRAAASYEQLAADRSSYDGLISQLGWRPVAEIELYRGCTRRKFCSFCNEPVNTPTGLRDLGFCGWCVGLRQCPRVGWSRLWSLFFEEHFHAVG